MSLFSLSHVVMLLVTVALIVGVAILMKHVSRRVQNIVFITAAILCSLGIFYRYAMGLTIAGGITLKPLLLQMLQVCNFNFLLMPLVLIPRCKIVRQYVLFFSMFSAATTLLSPSGGWSELVWYAPTILNSWVNHALIVALPIWMMAAGRIRPERKYVLPVTGCVFGYYTVAYAISELLIAKGILTVATTHSFIYKPGGIAVLEILYRLIPYPYFYLYPLIPLLALFFFAFAYIYARVERSTRWL